MNIKEAKEQVKYSVISYLSRDEFGDYRIPIERQRPLFLMGPPGIGKTDIMSQIANEMDIALVSYSMTHHTRQSALGLPFIANKDYDGKEYRTTEYTMSEIIASVYDVMEETGKKEGILFLDEINCISETLAPSMLQFLQFKTFGRHSVPDGWIVVTAGNPPEYNNSVRDFDLATLDRLKRMDIEPDFQAWRGYAENEGVHMAVLTYLEIKKDDFYSVQTTVDGKTFVTARGWVDLSDMMKLYEQNRLPISIDLIRQYIHDERIARDFSAYYDLFYRFREEYYIEDLLEGQIREGVIERAKDSPFDERLTVLRLITDSLNGEFREVYEAGRTIRTLLEIIKKNRDALAGATVEEATGLIAGVREGYREELRKGRRSKSMSKEDARLAMAADHALSELDLWLRQGSGDPSWTSEGAIRAFLAERNAERRTKAERAGARLANAFAFLEQAYTEEREILIFVTTLTENRYSVDFISNYGSEAYYRHNKGLLLYEREQDLAKELAELEE
ncbi:MAG: AAA family ATPase [Mogibacterium sp.]|nr:AAA family ATPase [Mogibacterium sp.]